MGVRVVPMVREKASGKVVRGPAYTHHIVLMGIYADSKARIKLANTLSQAAYLGCGYCWMNGVYVDTMRFAGYAQPVPCSRGHLGLSDSGPAQAMQMGEDDESLRLTAEAWLERGRDLDEQHAAFEEDNKRPPQSRDPPEDRAPTPAPSPEFWGCHRSCMFTTMLWYVHPLLLFLIPFAHTYFRGVLRGFCDEICQQPDSLSGQAASSESFQSAYCQELQNWADQLGRVAATCQVHLETAQAAYQQQPTALNKKLMLSAAKQHTAATQEAEACLVLLDFTREAVVLPTPRHLRPELALTAAERHEIDARSQHMTDTPDMGRPYTRFLQKRGMWTIEEWRRAQKPWLPLLFAENLCAGPGRSQVGEHATTH